MTRERIPGQDLPTKRRVLVASHDFPPFRTSGVYRITGLTKYLPSCGWAPTILAAWSRGTAQDPSLLKRVPATVHVVRSRSPRLATFEDATARTLKKAGALKPTSAVRRVSRTDRLLRSVAAFIRSCLYFPDENISWIPSAVAKAVGLHRKERFDVIYTTSPPRSTPLIGLLLKALLDVPWVIEFRDPWFPSDRPLRKRIEAKLEGFLLRHADAVIVVTKAHAEHIRSSHGVDSKKLSIICNGYDEDDFCEGFATRPSAFEEGCLHLSHFGTIYPGSSGMFFPVLTEFVKEHPEIARRLRVNIIGYPDETVLRYAKEPTLKDIIRIQPLVSHSESLRMMCTTHYLLLFYGRQNFRLTIAGKTYEYLRSGQPILAITKDGGVKELIEQGKAGWAVDPNDTETIKGVLDEMLKAHSNGHLPNPARPEFLAQFRYDSLARKVADVLERVAGDGRR